MFQIRQLSRADVDWVLHFLEERWFSTRIVRRGGVVHADRLPGFIALKDGKAVGLVTYRIDDHECEIVTLDSLVEGMGIGSALIGAVKASAVSAKCDRIWLITTNDNLSALRFYQKRGFVLVALYPNAVEQSRKLKPEIPLIGAQGIPLRDEIEIEMLL